ncbi:SRPBCC domain-containing protein [Candidatus Microgenomates bacterium]|nr:MAG: SRPBCC domain-containing protein [Candidatus Microgenomates bacterium]
MEEELVITRIFNAPREKVWKAWTQPKQMMCWWGPKGFTSPVIKIDLHVGGKYLSSMRSPEEKDYWSTGRYEEINEPEKLVMTDSFSDEKGNVVSAAYYGMSSDFPKEMLITVLFEEMDDKTKLTLRHSGIGGINPTDKSNMEQGWNQSLDKLEECLKE